MKLKSLKLSVAAGAVCLALLGTSASSWAGTVCTGIANNVLGDDQNMSNNVSGALGCELGSTNNDKPIPDRVNLDLMFGFADWAAAGKVDPAATGSNGSLSIIGDNISGTFSVTAALSATILQYMLVLKDGKDTPPVYVGYLLGSLAGSYLTPFINLTPNPDTYKGISHISLYVRDTGEIKIDLVPVPGGLLLLLTGLGGLAALGRARKKAV